MRFLLFLPLCMILSHASMQDLSSFHANFEQTIIDDNKKVIRYSGELWASKPQNALWTYRKPIQKSVYINGKKLTVIEPLIEQATIRTLGDEIDFLEIIKKAKPISPTRYTATVKGQTYYVDLSNNLISSISYTDGYDNKITIKFLNPVHNQSIDSSRYKPIIPKDFDIITD